MAADGVPVAVPHCCRDLGVAMNARDAREIAARWLERGPLETFAERGLIGAVVGGSLASLADDEAFSPAASDIDVFLFVDTAILAINPAMPHGVFTVSEGCLIQGAMVDATVLDDEATLLGMLGLGCNLRYGRVMFDVEGTLERARAIVDQRWAAPTWVAHRTSRAISFASDAMARCVNADSTPGRLETLTDAVTQLAGVLAFAERITPTHRRALVVARQQLERLGRLDLFDRLLGLIGATSGEPATANAGIADAVVAVEIELRYGDISYDNTDESRRVMAALVEGGLRQMVEAGAVAEAMLPIAASVVQSGLVVGDRRSRVDGATLDQLLDRRVEASGIAGDHAWHQRVRDLADVGDHVFGLASTLTR